VIFLFVFLTQFGVTPLIFANRILALVLQTTFIPSLVSPRSDFRVVIVPYTPRYFSPLPNLSTSLSTICIYLLFLLPSSPLRSDKVFSSTPCLLRVPVAIGRQFASPHKPFRSVFFRFEQRITHPNIVTLLLIYITSLLIVLFFS